MKLSHFSRMLVSLGAASLLALSAQAADWSTDFEPPPESWVSGGVTNPPTGESGTFTDGVESGYYRIKDDVAADAGGTFAGFGVMPDAFTDVTVGGIVNVAMDSNDDVGVVARADDMGNGYFGNVDYGDGTACIAKVSGYVTADFDICSAVGGLATDTSHYIELTALGSNPTELTLNVYDMAGGTLLETVSHTDSTDPYVAGISGVYVVPMGPLPGANSDTVNATWDNVFSSTVPEPASASLVLFALGGLLLGRRSRR